ncbi:ferritin-like domain-containing protein [Solitalea lacus]|uniref:YciE/YciF ferroxidase family protein n=1 Tax=Solitalea lacus TaxID=2911172 RepID=UPI001EDA6CA1|nr:DUF892 family protein [Solitalea lacus]UKJ06694.1 DUF892 family protein [Solitalea lacus]
MEKKNHSIITLHDLMIYELKKIADGELQLYKVLPMWINKASLLKLKEVLKKYTENIHQQTEKLETFFREEGILQVTDLNEAMKAFIKETECKINSCANTEVLDVCLLSSIQEINHYKISVYGTVTSFAHLLKKTKEAQLFHQAEIVEKHIDDRLSQLAEFEVNQKANIHIAFE